MRLVVFDSTSDVIAADIELRSCGLAVKIVPLPASISARCGMGLQVDEIEKVEQILKSKNIVYSIELIEQ